LISSEKVSSETFDRFLRHSNVSKEYSETFSSETIGVWPARDRSESEHLNSRHARGGTPEEVVWSSSLVVARVVPSMDFDGGGVVFAAFECSSVSLWTTFFWPWCKKGRGGTSKLEIRSLLFITTYAKQGHQYSGVLVVRSKHGLQTT
jgi:hypothetical protein